MLKEPKLCASTNSSPTVAMKTSGMNFSTVVITWKAPMFRTPVRLIAAGIHSPTSAMSTDIAVRWPVLTNTSTYPTHATTMAAFPAHAVIQYDQALRKPANSPKASRA